MNAAFSPHAAQVAYASEDVAQRCEIKNGRTHVVTKSFSKVFGVAWAPDGRHIAVAEQGHGAIVPVAGKAAGRTGHEDQIDVVRASADGAWIATGGDDGAVLLWNARTGKLARTLRGSVKRRILALAFSPDSKRVAAAVRDGEVKVWRVADGAEVKHVRVAGAFAWDMAFTPDGSKLAVAVRRARGQQRRSGVTVFDTRHWSSINIDAPKPAGTAHEVIRLGFVTSNAALVRFANNRLGRLSLAARTLVETGASDNVRRLAVSAANDKIVACDVHNRCFVRNLAGKPLGVLRGLRSRPVGIAVSAGGAFIAAAERSGRITIWSAKTFRVVAHKHHRFGATDLTWLHDGRLVTAGQNGVAVIWPVTWKR